MKMASSRHIAASKPRLLKHLFFPNFSPTSKPLHRFSSSSSTNDPKSPPLSTPKPQPHIIIQDQNPTPPPNNKIEDAICRIMQDDDWSTGLQTSIRDLVPLFDHNLVSNVLNRIPNNRALEFFQWVESSGFKHDKETHVKIIYNLCRDRRFDEAKKILLSKKGFDYSEYLFIHLIRCYANSNRKWDTVKNCVNIFLKMEELGVPRTTRTYGSLLEVMIRCNKYKMAEKFYNKMLSEGIVPSQHTYRLMILGFCRSSRVETAHQYFQDMKSRNFSPTFVHYNAMINGYVQVKKMEEAEKLFIEMKGREIEPFLDTYNSMINGYTRVKRLVDAENLLAEMKSRNMEPNFITYNTMVNGYALVGKMGDAKKLVLEMKERSIEPDLVTYVTMIRGYVTANMVDDALEMVEEMKGRRFGEEVDVNLCLGVLNDECDVEKMCESQRNVLRVVEEYVERVDL
ncbi:hypothetical protein SSX86_031806, partial [Deinandra increscens subsp. villosa]